MSSRNIHAGLALTVLLALGPAAAGAQSPQPAKAKKVTISGRIRGLPKKLRGVAVTVEAISLRNGSVVAAAGASTHYSLRVPAGPYLLVSNAAGPKVDLSATRAISARKSSRGKTLKLHRARGSSLARLAAAGVNSGGALGLGDVPITFPNGQSYKSGGEDPMFIGLLPVCAAKGGKLIDRTKAVQKAIQQEQKLSDEGRTEFKFQLHPITPDATIQGQIGVGPNGGPRADLEVVDSSGNTLKHYVIGGDPEDWDTWTKWAKQVGEGIGHDLASEPPPITPDPCEPETTGLMVTGTYHGQAFTAPALDRSTREAITASCNSESAYGVPAIDFNLGAGADLPVAGQTDPADGPGNIFFSLAGTAPIGQPFTFGTGSGQIGMRSTVGRDLNSANIYGAGSGAGSGTVTATDPKTVVINASLLSGDQAHTLEIHGTLHCSP